MSMSSSRRKKKKNYESDTSFLKLSGSLYLPLMAGFLQNLVLASSESDNQVLALLQHSPEGPAAAFPHKDGPEGKYSARLQVVGNHAAGEKAMALDELYNMCQDLKIQPWLICDLKEAVVSRLGRLTRHPECVLAPGDKGLINYLGKVVVQVLRSDVNVDEYSGKYTGEYRLTSPIVIKRKHDVYFLKKLTQAEPVAPARRLPSEEEEEEKLPMPISDLELAKSQTISTESAKMDLPLRGIIVGSSVDPQPKVDEEVAATTMTTTATVPRQYAEKITRLKREACEILLQDRTHSFSLYNSIEALEQLSLEDMATNVSRLARLPSILAELEGLSKEYSNLDPTLPSTCATLKRVVDRIQTHKLSASSALDGTVSAINSAITIVKHKYPACHKCFSKEKETKKLLCGHRICEACMDSLCSKLMDCPAQVAVKCPIEHCYYTLGSEEIVRVFGDGRLDRIQEHNVNYKNAAGGVCMMCCKKMPKLKRTDEQGHMLCESCLRRYVERASNGDIFIIKKAFNGSETSVSTGLPVCPVLGCEKQVGMEAVKTCYHEQDLKESRDFARRKAGVESVGEESKAALSDEKKGN